jgi:hypothetical protein
MSGQSNPRYKPIGTKRITFRGGIPYCEVKIANPDVWQYEHRLVIERNLGRSLNRHEIVHHKDGNGLNNNPDNLQIVSTATHNKLHPKNLKWSRRFDKCRHCKSTENPHICHGLCQRCYSYLRAHNELNQWKLHRFQHAYSPP